MRKSRSDAAETKERIVSTATRMFLENGLEAVGMRDIMAGAGLTVGGFYRHFDSKEQLIAETNRAAFHRLLTMLENETAGKPPAAAVERIVSLYLGQTQGKDKTYLCPLSMLGGELSHGDAQVRNTAMDGYQGLAGLLADRLTHLTKPRALTVARGIVSTMVGAVTLAGIAPDKVTANAILSAAKVLIEAGLGMGRKAGGGRALKQGVR